MGLGKKFEPKACTVYSRNGEYLIKTPNGEMIPCLHWIRVSDNCNEGPATLIAKMQCNIASNNENFDLPIKLYNEQDVEGYIKEIYELRLEIKGRREDLVCMLDKSFELKSIKSKWWYQLFKNI